MNEAVVHTMEYYSAIKRSTFESVLVRWMNLEPVIQNEVNQTEENKNHILTYIYIYIHIYIYMESRKMILMNLFAGQEWRHRPREQTLDTAGKREEGDELRE